MWRMIQRWTLLALAIGLSGCAGPAGRAATAGAVHANVITIPIEGFRAHCGRNVSLRRWDQDRWREVPLAPADSPAYELDGEVRYRGMCDAIACQPARAPVMVALNTFEAVSGPGAAGGSVAGLPRYRAIPLTGTLRVEVAWSADAACQDRRTTVQDIVR